MGDLLIRNVPDYLREKLADSARRSGRSLSDEAKRMISKVVLEEKSDPVPSGQSLLDGIQAALARIPDEEREEFADIMDGIEAERKKDFGRPFSFDE
jgi:plasmid stability protein